MGTAFVCLSHAPMDWGNWIVVCVSTNGWLRGQQIQVFVSCQMEDTQLVVPRPLWPERLDRPNRRELTFSSPSFTILQSVLGRDYTNAIVEPNNKRKRNDGDADNATEQHGASAGAKDNAAL